MFLVGGGILTHGLPALHHAIESLAERLGALPGVGGALKTIAPTLLDGVAGIVAGALALGAVALVRRTWGATRAAA
jgi:hypothetical protein